jgi:hypothetical protein
MIRFNIFAAAAILAAIVASPASAQQAMDEPGMFAFYHPNGDLHIGSRGPPADAQAQVPARLLMQHATPARAETVHRSNLGRVVRLNRGLTLGPAASGWAYAPPRPPIRYHDTPSYDDPSKFGGGEALPIDP